MDQDKNSTDNTDRNKCKHVRCIVEINDLGHNIPRLIHLSDGKFDSAYDAFIKEIRKSKKWGPFP